MYQRKCDGLVESGQGVNPKLDNPNAPTFSSMKDLNKPLNPQTLIRMREEELYRVEMCMYLDRAFARVKHDIT